jgi:16S rRNA (guanine527-N7)-methyltransferase
MQFSADLETLLPRDLPNREQVIWQASAHLELIVEANKSFNLTRITSPREAAIKHVLDSVLPWRLFADAGHVLDAGTGAGYPGIPLALVLPQVRFTLSESVGKKARFVEYAVRSLEIPNVQVKPIRAEEILRFDRADLVTARAVAPVGRAASLFAPALRLGATALLYKGPEAASEITEAAAELRRWNLSCRIVTTYDLPDGLGSRTIVGMVAVKP